MVVRIDEQTLTAVAGEQAYRCGAADVRRGRVVECACIEGGVSAVVTGDEDHTVRVRWQGGALRGTCDCPVGEQGEFCRHCVATALVAAERNLLEAPVRGRAGPAPVGAGTVRTAAGGTAGHGPAEAAWPARRPVTRGGRSTKPDLAAAVEALSHGQLVAIVLAEAERNSRLANTLLTRAGVLGAADARELADLGRRIRRLFGGILDGGEPRPLPDPATYAAKVARLADQLELLVARGASEPLISLIEQAMVGWDRMLVHFDEHAGEHEVLQQRLQDLHAVACATAEVDPMVLAHRLLDMRLDAHVDLAGDAPESHAEALGEKGVDAFHAEARRRYEALPSLGRKGPPAPSYPAPETTARPGPDRGDHRRSNLARIVEQEVRRTGDLDDLVRIIARDLSDPRRYARIAEEFRQAGRFDDALCWVRRGLEVFPPDDVDLHLHDLLVTVFEETGRQAESRGALQDLFATRPTLDRYRRLAAHCGRDTDWQAVRAAALGILREALRHEDVARILLADGEPDAAWTEAVEAEAAGHECSRLLWLELAVARERTHPLDAVPVYRGEVDQLVAIGGREAYAKAVRRIVQIRGLLERAGHAEESVRYVAGIRAAFRRKRTLMAALTEAGL